MARHNRPRRRRRMMLEDRFDTDVCFLPGRPEIDRVIAVPLKTIYRNVDAAPWAAEVVTVRSFSDPLLGLIQRGMQ